MVHSGKKVAGTVFFVAVTQLVLGLIIAEASYHGYNVSANYISDLGIGPSSIVFNSSAFLLGLLLIFGLYLLKSNSELKTVKRLLFVMALGAIGVGIFTKNH